ncbi:MAG: YidC/Oxa1 family membrane protein insertase [Firmicutes bacterium]|nr:YidC/Oxa1 family membrane protein insertase [Bacillota bacterium]
MIDAIAQFFGVVISAIYEYIPNFGMAIIIMTVMVKLVTFPLNNKQIQSAKKMQALQPEMKKIQQKYKDDKEKQNQAMSEFMRENNMNPLAGCLPLLVQFPVLIGIFRLLQDAGKYLDMNVINQYLFQSAELIDLLKIPLTNLSFSAFTSQFSYYYIFPLIAGATTYLYSQMSMSSDSSQKMMLYMMPVMITVFSFSFPVGLVIYWIMNNVFSIGQHKLIVHLDAIKEKEKAPVAAEAQDKKSNKDQLIADREDRTDAKTETPEKEEKTAKPRSKKGKGKR